MCLWISGMSTVTMRPRSSCEWAFRPTGNFRPKFAPKCMRVHGQSHLQVVYSGLALRSTNGLSSWLSGRESEIWKSSPRLPLGIVAIFVFSPLLQLLADRTASTFAHDPPGFQSAGDMEEKIADPAKATPSSSA